MSDDRQQVESLASSKLTASAVTKIEQASDQSSSDDSTGEEQKVTVTELVGQFGWWQLNIATFYFIAYVLTTFNNLGVSFHAAKTDYRCVQWANFGGSRADGVSPNRQNDSPQLT